MRVDQRFVRVAAAAAVAAGAITVGQFALLHPPTQGAGVGSRPVIPLFRSPLPPAKQKLAEKMYQRLAAGHNYPGPRGSQADLLPGKVLPFTMVPGILAMKQTPFGAGQFLGQNFWKGPLQPGVWILVYAGQQVSPTVSGALYVERELVNAQVGIAGTSPIGMFLAPTGRDPVRVVGWSGTLLTLQTTAGATLTFNVATDRYGTP